MEVSATSASPRSSPSPSAVPGATPWTSRPNQRWRAVVDLAPLGIIIAAFVVCYRDVFAILVDQWTTIDANSHGFLIPFLSGYLVWSRRAAIARTPWCPAPAAGFVVLCGAMACLALGSVSETATIQELSLLPALGGIVLAVFGWRVLGRVWIAIVYLALMMPLLDPFGGVHGPLQAFAARVGSALLSAGGIPVLHTATIIQMPHATLEVVRACSGVNNLVAMLAIGVLIAELTIQRWPLRVAFVGFALVVALFANPVRVAFIGALLELGYEGYLPGDGHEVQGLLVSGGAFLILIGGASVLRRLFDRERAVEARLAPPPPGSVGAVPPTLRLWAPAVLCVAALLVGAFHPGLLARAIATPPMSVAPPAAPLGEWRAAKIAAGPAAGPLGAVPASLEPRIFRRRDSGVMVAVVALPLFSAGSQDSRLTDLIGASEPITITIPAARAIRVNETVFDISGRSLNAVYWYRVDGEIVPSRIEARLRGAFARLLHHPEPAAVFAVLGPAAPYGHPDTVRDFAGELFRSEETRSARLTIQP